MYTKDQLKELDKIPKLKYISLKVIQEFYCDYLTNRVYKYILRPHKSKEEFEINIIFFRENLPHLLAIHKIVPQPNTYLYKGANGYNGIVNENITIEKLINIDSQKPIADRILPTIENRLTCFYLIPRLMNECKIVKFSQENVRGNSNIKSDFILYSEELGVKLNLGVIKEQIDKKIYVPETFIVKPLRSRDSNRLTDGQSYMNIIDFSVEDIS